MPLKAFIVSTQELQGAIKNIIEKKGMNVTSVEITVNEEGENFEDVAIVTVDGNQDIKEIESFIPQMNELFSIDIRSYEGFDFAEFAGQKGGYVFLIN